MPSSWCGLLTMVQLTFVISHGRMNGGNIFLMAKTQQSWKFPFRRIWMAKDWTKALTNEQPSFSRKKECIFRVFWVLTLDLCDGLDWIQSPPASAENLIFSFFKSVWFLFSHRCFISLFATATKKSYLAKYRASDLECNVYWTTPPAAGWQKDQVGRSMTWPWRLWNLKQKTDSLQMTNIYKILWVLPSGYPN